jgi:hypothetical protein
MAIVVAPTESPRAMAYKNEAASLRPDVFPSSRGGVAAASRNLPTLAPQTGWSFRSHVSV